MPSNSNSIFGPSIRSAFLDHLRESPSNRRVSPTDRETILEWLTNPSKRPVSQEEFSRRHYVRKTFCWDENAQRLLAISKVGEDKIRLVVTEDIIVDIVESVHEMAGHPGWDFTWKEISTSYYGILRTDVIFLLKRCPLCAKDPSKRPKGTNAKPALSSINPEVPEIMNTSDGHTRNETWESESMENLVASICQDIQTHGE